MNTIDTRQSAYGGGPSRGIPVSLGVIDLNMRSVESGKAVLVLLGQYGDLRLLTGVVGSNSTQYSLRL
jgi:hypothetical protein